MSAAKRKRVVAPDGLTDLERRQVEGLGVASDEIVCVLRGALAVLDRNPAASLWAAIGQAADDATSAHRAQDYAVAGRVLACADRPGPIHEERGERARSILVAAVAIAEGRSVAREAAE